MSVGSPLARRCSLALVALGALALAGCHSRHEEAQAPKPVVAVAVHPDGQPPKATLPGQIEARYSTPLSFRVAGKITERLVRLGDTVKAGQRVAKLDPADAQKNVANAQAQLDAAAHRLVYAKQQLERDRAQAQENLIAPAQLEQTQDAYAAARAQRDAAQSQLALVTDQLRYTTLDADHSGVITAEDADTGQNVAAGQAVYHLAWSGETDVVCDAPEGALGALGAGRTATVTLPALPGKSFAARVREVAPAADPQSRTYRVKLTMQAPGPDVRLGMTANVSFEAASAGAPGHRYTLPSTALFHQGERPAVWVVRAGSDTLELRPIEVARYDERTISVATGLADGERVVLQGVHAVSAGEHVRVVAPLHPEDFAS
ncbi:efflux RND transporter periplasmic adaptor subunit [Trinickia caryophylli]|uniref:RND family efflux transporter, MFP subunit n=1 Tax=Trinickia caryophylli TaxID=28094 RepID=A0A1X7FZC7_TRICW|nr:efflux RND transporter periplasmic adaptor subunit [Trinickia caryophylli]PMS11680.1 efflux RND transporter periplasmic adaptor subunit [Trinickia caryophylli]TRX20178.1 efflux RND transporter periplasmic adaptor subunit [Trinickia caryophylli]WQE13805.1 efflux RND transporter periplasmic adaptor subunit [Trinickia caryophylli]SMF60777.1 RND family efflux transporter, MFP subunit [Trinickia caryophylli]GLU34590.1 RND transporter MFP subunit [Trinickia caryophylli]